MAGLGVLLMAICLQFLGPTVGVLGAGINFYDLK